MLGTTAGIKKDRHLFILFKEVRVQQRDKTGGEGAEPTPPSSLRRSASIL